MNYHRTVLMVEKETDGFAAQAINSAADIVVFDFEHATLTEDAIDDVNTAIEDMNQRVGVRIPDITTSAGLRGLERFTDMEVGLGFLMLPDVTGPAELGVIDEYLTTANSTLDLIVILENPTAIFNAYSIATASPRITGLVFGPMDFRRTMELPVFTEPDVSIPRYLVAMAAAAASIPAYDMPTIGGDSNQIKQEAHEARAMGYDGKIAMAEAEVPLINQSFSPSEQERERAAQIIEEADATDGRVEVDGRPYPPWMIKRLRELLDRSD